MACCLAAFTSLASNLTRARGAALMMVLAARREAVVCDSTPVQQLR